MDRDRQPPHALRFPNGAIAWRRWFAHHLRVLIWPNGNPPRNVYGRLAQFDYNWLRTRWPGVTQGMWRMLHDTARRTINHHVQARSDLAEMARPVTAMAYANPNAFLQREMPFASVDDNVYMEATQANRNAVLTRHMRTQHAREYVVETANARLPKHSRYTEAWEYQVLPNDFENRVNADLVWTRMAAHVGPPGREYRVRLVWQMQENQVDRRPHQTNVFGSAADWMAPASFENFFETLTSFFISNDDVDIVSIHFFLDIYEEEWGGGGKHMSAKRTKSESVLAQCGGVFVVPQDSDGLCGWMVLVSFLMNHPLKPEGWPVRKEKVCSVQNVKGTVTMPRQNLLLRTCSAMD